MNPLKSTWNQVGRVDPVLFSPNGKNNAKVSWTTPPPDPASVRIIATPNNVRLPDAVTTGHTAPVVVLIDQVNNIGFDISAFNPEGLDGEAGFDYLALSENAPPTTPNRLNQPDLHFGISQPRVLKQGGTIGDWGAWTTQFSKPFTGGVDDPVIRLLTAHNMGDTGLSTQVSGDQTDVQDDAQFEFTRDRQGFTVAAVGIGCQEFTDIHMGMAYMARNVDAIDGKVGFNWLALISGANSPSTGMDLMVDSGLVLPRFFKSHPNPDEWEYHEIQFSSPFGETPVVFVTGFSDRAMTAPNLPRNPTAVVPVVFNPTRFGFTLAARNTEDRYGQTGFFWVAISCSVGCG